jgi:hypothetical protein
MPGKVRDAYDRAGWAFMCTCEEGAAHEARLLGASYEDVILERLGRAAATVQEERVRSAARDLHGDSREPGDRAPSPRDQSDPAHARGREALEEARRGADEERDIPPHPPAP